MNYRFITVVWGEAFVKMLVEMAIPNQLSPGNLPSIPNLESSKYVIYTVPEDARTIQESRSYSLLSSMVPVEFIYIDDDVLQRNKYAVLTDCSVRDLRATESEDVAYVYLYPDVLWADGSFKTMSEITEAGKRAILVGPLSVNRETAFEAAGRFISPEDGSINVSSRQLVKFGLDHLDSYVDGLCWGSPHFDNSPAQIYWRVEDEGMLMRGFPLGPFMVRPKGPMSYFAGSVDDGDFIRRACPEFDDIHVVEDSDEIFHISLAPSPDLNPPNKARPVDVARWAAKNTNRHQRRFFEYRIRAHHSDLTPAWKEIEAESDKVVAAVRSFLRLKLLFLVSDWRWSLNRIRWTLRSSRVGDTAIRFLRRAKA